MTKTRKFDGRTRILIAAETVAIRDGARRLTLETAANQAGMSKGGVLYHFPTKHALLAGMLDRAMAEMRAALTEHRTLILSRGQSNPTLRALVLASKDKLCNKTEVRIALIAGLSEYPGLMTPVGDTFAVLWTEILAECPDPLAALAIWSAIEGIMTLDMFGVSPISQDQSLEFFDHLTRMIDALPYHEVSA